MSDLVERLRTVHAPGNFLRMSDMVELLNKERAEAAAELEKLRVDVARLQKLDEGAAKVEAIICMRSWHFTGKPPYVGWEGLAKALSEDYGALEALEYERRA